MYSIGNKSHKLLRKKSYLYKLQTKAKLLHGDKRGE